MKIFKRFFESLESQASSGEFVPRGVIIERIDAQKTRGRRSAIFMEMDISPKDARFLRSQGYKVSRKYIVGMPTFEIFW